VIAHAWSLSWSAAASKPGGRFCLALRAWENNASAARSPRLKRGDDGPVAVRFSIADPVVPMWSRESPVPQLNFNPKLLDTTAVTTV